MSKTWTLNTTAALLVSAALLATPALTAQNQSHANAGPSQTKTGPGTGASGPAVTKNPNAIKKQVDKPSANIYQNAVPPVTH